MNCFKGEAIVVVALVLKPATTAAVGAWADAREQQRAEAEEAL